MSFSRKFGSFWVFAIAANVLLCAHADTVLTSNAYLGTRHINGISLTTQNGYFYGASSTAASTAAKEVTISSIDAANLTAGQVIVVTPSYTSTATTAHTLRLNPSQTGAAAAKPIYYNGAAVSTAADGAKVWVADVPSTFVYDGTNWVFAGSGGETGETYTDFVGASVVNDTPTAGSGGLVPAPAAGDDAKFLKGDGTWGTPTDTTYSVFGAATSNNAGTAGLVPAPAAGDQNKVLTGSGWGYVNIPVAAGAPSTNTPTGSVELWVQ